MNWIYFILVRGVLREAVLRPKVDLASSPEQRRRQTRLPLQNVHRQHVDLSSKKIAKPFKFKSVFISLKLLKSFIVFKRFNTNCISRCICWP